MPEVDEDTLWLLELFAPDEPNDGGKGRDGAWADDEEADEFLAYLLSAPPRIDWPALPPAFAAAPAAAGRARPSSPAAAPRKRKAEPAGLRQDARDFATPAPTPQMRPRHEPVQRREPEPGHEPTQHRERAASVPAVSVARLLPTPLRRRREFDASCLPEAVRRLPTTGRLLEALATDVCMELDVPRRSAMAGAVLEHAAAVIARQLQPGPAVFKIGITMNPIHRWHNKEYGYGHSADKYIKMVVLLISDRGEAAAFLEAALIKQFRDTAGCRNIASGGEGLRPAEGPFLHIW